MVVRCQRVKKNSCNIHKTLVLCSDSRGLDLFGPEQGQVAGAWECSNDSQGSIKCGETSCLAEDLLASQEGFCAM